MTFKFVNVSVICEGQTELDFVKKKLNKQYFNSKGISLKPLAINKSETQHSLEGNVSIERVVTFVKRAEFPIVTTFVDFYGFKNKGSKSVCEVEEELREKVDKEFFIPYLQLHETEALWFSDVCAIVVAKNANKTQTQSLKEIANKYKTPEDINDSKETAPSKRLESIFLDYGKIIDGNAIFDKISVDVMKQKCPRFAKWIDKIEEVAEIFK